jgi:hypothetical protein
MSKPRYGAPRDANQSDLCKFANSIPGCKAKDLGAVGDDIPDLLIGWKGENLLAEVKREPVKGEVFPSQVQLSDGQEVFHDEWPGQVCVIRNEDDLLDLLKIDR